MLTPPGTLLLLKLLLCLDLFLDVLLLIRVLVTVSLGQMPFNHY
jgi:hypothetical protein